MRVSYSTLVKAKRAGRATSVRVAPTGTAVEQYQVPLGNRHSLKEAGVIGLPSWSDRSTQTETWTKVPRLSATCPRRVTVFDGGKGSIDKTMEFGDDFDGTAIDTAKWTFSGPALTISNSVIQTVPGNYIYARTLASTEGTRTVFRVKSTQIGGTSSSYQILGVVNSASQSLCRAQYTHIGTGGVGYVNSKSGTGSSLKAFASTPSANVWFTHSLTRDGSGAAKWKIDDGAVTTFSTLYDSNVMGPYIGRDGSGTTPVLSVDYMYVRKYTASEPLTGTAQPTATNRALSRHMRKADLIRACCT